MGRVVLRFIRAVMTPPAVSITREEGQHQEEDPQSSPQESMAVWTAEPYATTSSELMLLLGTLLWKSETSLTMRRIRLEPPIETISWTFDCRSWSPGGPLDRLQKRSWQSSSKRARVREVEKSMPSESRFR